MFIFHAVMLGFTYFPTQLSPKHLSVEHSPGNGLGSYYMEGLTKKKQYL